MLGQRRHGQRTYELRAGVWGAMVSGTLWLMFGLAAVGCKKNQPVSDEGTPDVSSVIPAISTSSVGNKACDMEVVPGERIGSNLLSPGAEVEIATVPHTTYCSKEWTWTSVTTMDQVKKELKGCSEKKDDEDRDALECAALGLRVAFSQTSHQLVSLTVFERVNKLQKGYGDPGWHWLFVNC
jgi:hypothetical protein